MRLVLLLPGLVLYLLAILIEIEILEGNNFQNFISINNQKADILLSIVTILLLVFGVYLLSATNFYFIPFKNDQIGTTDEKGRDKFLYSLNLVIYIFLVMLPIIGFLSFILKS